MTAMQTLIQGVAPCRLRPGEIAVDLFAGGGGASRGIELATGISPAIAINHDPDAIKMHEANHPDTIHFCQSVYHDEVHPRTLAKDQKVGVLWLSPDCRHFSRAKGSAPVSASVRSLAWIGLRWAKCARPRIVVLENVAEFQTWGPLSPDGTPNKARAGETFQAFVREWRHYGYTVEWGTRIAADFGIPTTRKRLFLVARCDGEPIRQPVPTHGKLGKPKPWRTAAECIDWSDLGSSIFERKRPLAPATCRRIARGIVRYVLTAAKPFIVQIGQRHERGDAPVDEPRGTVMPTQRDALVTPYLVETAHGEHVQRPGDGCPSLERPLAAASLVRMHHGDKQWAGADEPLATVCSGANHHALVAAFLAKHNGGATGQDAREPLHSVAGHINKALVAAHLTVFRENSVGRSMDEPMPTVTSGAGSARPAGAAHAMALVAAFLVQYYSTGTDSQALDEPLATIVSRARHGLVTVMIDGAEYAIVDIRMRMLKPRELARAQGFDDSYILTGNQSQQVARIGNSVPPGLAAAVLAAQLDPESPTPSRRSKVAAA